MSISAIGELIDSLKVGDIVHHDLLIWVYLVHVSPTKTMPKSTDWPFML